VGGERIKSEEERLALLDFSVEWRNKQGKGRIFFEGL
jgi:hypothetical protein